MLTKLPEIFTVFEQLEDPRRQGGNKQHRLFDMVFIALCGTICNCDSWADIEKFGNRKIDWFRKFIRLEHGVASHDTFGRVFAALDTGAFAVCLQDWINRLQLDLKGLGIHIDGKTLRHSFDTATDKSALHMVSAWVNDLGICLGQVATDEKSNEITAVPMLLELLDIEGGVVTLDAMNCQRKTAACIRDQQADYLMTVKRNQPELYDLICDRFTEFGEDNYSSHKVRSHKTTRKTRGRIEEREVFVSAAPRELKESGRWRDIKTIGMVYRHRQHDGKSKVRPVADSEHATFFISSLPPRARTVSRYVHGHWSVENSLHWSLDVTFTEDASRIRKGNGQEVIASLRRLALSILKRDTSLKKTSLRAKRLVAGWSEEALEALIAGI